MMADGVGFQRFGARARASSPIRSSEYQKGYARRIAPTACVPNGQLCLRLHSARGGANDMNCKIGRLAAWCAAFLLALGFASDAAAQVFTGRIDVTIEDS